MTDTPVVMEQMVALHYKEVLPPNVVRFGEAMLAGRFLGGRCPSCQRVYVPNRGFCTLCVVPVGADDELEVPDRGVVASYTVITPVRYYGQTKTEPFLYASVVLDGTSVPLRGQDITGVPIESVRAGLRVEAVWLPPDQRSFEGLSARGAGVDLEGALSGFRATGEADLPPSSYQGFEF